MKSFVLLAAMLGMTGTAFGQDCEPHGDPADVDTGDTPMGRFYVANDIILGGVSVWIYQESNGIDGLQRADEVYDKTCGGQIVGDTLIEGVYA